MTQKMKPNLFLISAPRAGSTQLAHWLGSHEDIGLSAVKEPNFFSQHEFPPEYVAATHLNDVDPTIFAQGRQRPRRQFAVFRSQSDYECLFRRMKSPWRMEASTSYLSCPDAPEKIHSYAPDAHLIFLTRDPVERALSHYRLARRSGRTSERLAQVLSREISGELPVAERYLLRPSLQVQCIERFKSLFKPKQCFSIDFETLMSAPSAALNQIAQWLQIDQDGFNLDANARNASQAPRFERLNHAMQQSGVKCRLRQILPLWAKSAIRPIWFTDAAKIEISPEEKTALRAALDGIR